MIQLPVQCEQDLDHLECRLSIDEQFQYELKEMLEMQKSKLQMNRKNVSMTDLLTRIMPKEMWLDYNWNGKHTKKKLCLYEEIFVNCFREVVNASSEEFVPMIKKSIRALHNREHTANSRQRKLSGLN